MLPFRNHYMLINDFQIIGPKKKKKKKVLKVCLCACARAASPWHQPLAVLFCVRSSDGLWKAALNFTCTFMLNFSCC